MVLSAIINVRQKENLCVWTKAKEANIEYDYDMIKVFEKLEAITTFVTEKFPSGLPDNGIVVIEWLIHTSQ